MRKNYALLLLAFFALIPQVWAQSVTGVVVDENEEPLHGVPLSQSLLAKVLQQTLMVGTP